MAPSPQIPKADPVKTSIDPDTTPRAHRESQLRQDHLPIRPNIFSNPSHSAPILSPSQPLESNSSHSSCSTPSLSGSRKRKSPSVDTTSESSSAKRKRGGSPVKLTHMHDFGPSDTDIVYQQFGSPGYPIPPDMNDLVAAMRRIGKEFGVLPKEFQDRTVDGVDDTEILNYNKVESALSPESLDTFHGCILELLDRAMDCFNQKLAEPAWGSEVIVRLLDVALEHNWTSQRTWYRDITTARITDKSLLPKNAAGDVVQSKIVDYALVLNAFNQGSLNDMIRQRLEADQILAKAKDRKISINHTDYLVWSLIVVSIEIKKGLIGEEDLRVQLALWVSAHFKRLRQLNPGVKLPSLPLLSVQGHFWKFLLACPQDNDKIYILCDITVGDTRTAIGAYAVVAGVRRLAKWTEEVYLPWFRMCILGERSSHE